MESQMSTRGNERPEALATFAAAARNEGKKPESIGLTATGETAPISADPGLKQEAATRVLQEGVTGEDRGSDKLIDQLPDRILDNRDVASSNANSSDDFSETTIGYDATLDPRTGRPPTPLQAQELRQERMMDKALDQYLEANGMNDAPDAANEDQDISESDETAGASSDEVPARMAPPSVPHELEEELEETPTAR